MTKSTVNAKQTDAYFGAAMDWEADRMARVERSERRAWTVAIGSCLLTAISLVALVTILPLKRVVPYVYSVDRATGELTIMDAANERQTITNQALLDKHFANSYVLAREAYDWKLLQNDYDNTMAFSSPQVGAEYAQRFNGSKPITKVWGPNTEREVTVTSIQLAPDTVGKKAVIRYTVQQKDLQTNTLAPVEHYIATVAYEYHPQRTGREQDLIRNPLGYTVTSFRADPEIGGVPGVVPGSEGAQQP